MVRIRLQRHGRKKRPFYSIVAADIRAKRDGKFLEKLGTYNPITQPATIELDLDATLLWLEKGAQPSHTARNLLSRKGALLQHHLQTGVRKGAITQEQAREKFNAWLKDKNARIEAQKAKIQEKKAAIKAEALKAEKKANERRIAARENTQAPKATLKNTPETQA